MVPSVNNGFGFSLDGIVVLVELGYRWRTPGAIDDNRYEVGAIFDRNEYSVKIFDVPYFSPSSQCGRAAIYFQGQKMLWQTAPQSRRGIYAFTPEILGTSGSKRITNFNTDAGLVWIRPFASRPFDSMGIAINGLHYNNNFLDTPISGASRGGRHTASKSLAGHGRN